MGNLSLAVGEVSPSPVYGARLLSGLRANPSRGFKSRHLRGDLAEIDGTGRTSGSGPSGRFRPPAPTAPGPEARPKLCELAGRCTARS